MDFNRLQAVFEAASALSPDERAAYLAQTCGDEPEMRAEVEALLGVVDDDDLIPDAPLLQDWDERAVDALLGQRFGPYRVERLLGRGGMGAVFLGKRVDDEIEMEVSIKVMRPGRVSSAGMKRFRRERQLLADLRHPYIAALLDVGSLNAEQPYIIIEYIDGETVDQWRHTHQPELFALLNLFRKFAEAVAFAHAQGVIHRDIKPGNLMVTHGGVPKLLDFGIAALRRRMKPAPGLQQTAADGAMTPLYASPEQRDGRAVQENTDLYSLAVVLLECLLGESPREWGASPMEMITGLVVNGVGRGQAESGAGAGYDEQGAFEEIPEALGHVLRQALQPDPLRRYRQAEQLIADLDRVIGSLSGAGGTVQDDTQYDVFLWHNDEPGALALGARLARLGLRVFRYGGGDAGHVGMAEFAGRCRWCVVCLGRQNPPWFADPVGRDLIAFRSDRLRVLPLLLPGTPFPNRQSSIPRFLRGLAWFTFDEGMQSDRIATLAQQLRGDETEVGARFELCPFRGLEVFREQDSDFFIGREAVTQRIVAYLSKHPMMGVLGPSGSGKSSVVQAGVVPALRRIGGKVVLLKPGRRPVESLAFAVADALGGTDRQTLGGELAAALPRQPQALHAAMADACGEETPHLYLVIDQFEEVFTLAEDMEAAKAFIAALVFALEHPRRCCSLVLTMRSDFLGYCPLYPGLNTLLLDHVLQLEPMSSDDLRRAVTVPARMVGVDLQPGLTARILADVSGAPGKLPLLSHALLELYERREGGRLTVGAYEAVGGIEGALAHRAEAEFLALDPPAQTLLRNIFTHHLIHVGEVGENTRRTALREELLRIGGCPETVARLLDRWTAARLLTASQDNARGDELVDVAHEALIRRWPRILDWLAEDREAARHLNNLRRQARAWDDADRDPDHLIRGGLLLQMNTLINQDHTGVGALVHEFVSESWALEARRQAHEAGVRLRLMRHKNLALGAGGVAFLLATIAFGMFFRADRAEAGALLAEGEAKRQSETANLILSGMYESRAGDALDQGRPDHALLYSLAALANEIPADEAVPGAVGRFADPRMAGAERLLWTSPVMVPSRATALSGDGRWLAVAGADYLIRVMETGGVAGGEPRYSALPTVLSGHSDGINAMVMNHDGSLLISAGVDRRIRFWTRRKGVWRTRDHHAAVDQGAPVTHLALSRDERTLVALVGSTGLHWMRVDEPRVVRSQQVSPSPIHALALAPNGRQAACAAENGDLIVVGREAEPRVITRGVVCRDLVWLPKGLVGVTDEGALVFWRDPGRHGRAEPEILPSRGDPVVAAAPADKDSVWCLDRRGVLEQRAVPDGSARVSVPTGGRLCCDVRHIDMQTGGSLVALSLPQRGVQLHFAGDGELLAEQVGHTSVVWSVAVSPDGRTILSSGSDHRIQRWDLATGENLGDVRLSQASAAKAIYSPDGQTIAVTTYEGDLVLLEPDLRERRWLPGHTGLVYSAVFSPDGRLLASASADHTIRVWDVAAERAVAVLEAHQDDVRRLAFSPDGAVLASLANDESLAIWDVARFSRLAFFQNIDTNNISLTFQPEGKRLVWSTRSETLQIWDLAPYLADGVFDAPGPANSRYIETGHGALINNLVYSPDGRILATSANDGSVILLDSRTWKRLDRFAAHHQDTTSIAFTPDSQGLVTCSYDTRIRLWRTGVRIRSGTQPDGAGTINHLTFSPDGVLIAGSTSSQAVYVWCGDTGRFVSRFNDHDTLVRAVSFSPDGATLAGCGMDSFVYLWPLEGGAHRRFQTHHDDGITALAYAPDGALATGGGDGFVAVWDPKRETLRHRWEGHDHLIRKLAFSPNGRLLASMGFNGDIRLYDMAQGCFRRALIGHRGFGSSVAWSPDGAVLASGASDKIVRLWEMDSDGPPAALSGHRNSVEGVAFSPDGTFLASVDIEGVLFYWDAVTHEPLARFESPGLIVNSLVANPQNNTMASVVASTQVRFWHPERMAFFLEQSRTPRQYRRLLRNALHTFGYRFEGGTLVPEAGLTLAPKGERRGVSRRRSADEPLLYWLDAKN
ncbi:nSTAND1 domain-containing NTPase [Acanthopleuribacter pedis]|uniref:Protein kinase n=1 Tax=Acanthopleuribacter pedis TaxID=442870 RepID=A0A8J7U994_9BACT|nr:protein kinase [Acanthopleuribacter pedis]MBO1323436.1 protein kinase [Acanthopleuribacter pedis]